MPNTSPYELAARTPRATRFSQDSCTVAPSPYINNMVLKAVCIIINATAAASAATAFSFLAIPIATPIANSNGKLAKTELPAALITLNIALRIVPCPIIPVSL